MELEVRAPGEAGGFRVRFQEKRIMGNFCPWVCGVNVKLTLGLAGRPKKSVLGGRHCFGNL